MTIDKTLADREKTYGNYLQKAHFIQAMKDALHSHDAWWEMDYDMRESLDMIASKIGRILVGDPKHIDNWLDIAGYAQLVYDRLSKEHNANSKPKRKK